MTRWMLLLHLHNLNNCHIIQIKTKPKNMTCDILASIKVRNMTSYQAKRILRTAIDNELLHIKLVDVFNGAIIELDYELKTMDELFKRLNIITKQKANVILNDVGVILE